MEPVTIQPIPKIIVRSYFTPAPGGRILVRWNNGPHDEAWLEFSHVDQRRYMTNAEARSAAYAIGKAMNLPVEDWTNP